MFDFKNFQKQFLSPEMTIGLVDIGARGDSLPWIEPLLAATHIIAFEPDQDEAKNLKKTLQKFKEATVFDVGLWSETATLPLYLTRAATNISLFKTNPHYFDRYPMEKFTVDGVTECDVTSLDNVLAKDRKLRADVIKIDTQGAEYEILEGAKNTLKDCVCVVLEAWFFENYEGAKNFSDIEIMLRAQGFSFYGFMDFFTRNRRKLNKHHFLGRERMHYADAVFFKDPFDKKLDLNMHQIQVLFTMAFALGYYDFCYEIAEKKMGFDALVLENLKSFIYQTAALDSKTALDDIQKISAKMQADPNNAHILLHQWLDKFRSFSDLKDIILYENPRF